LPTRFSPSAATVGYVILSSRYLTVAVPVLLGLAACVHQGSGTTAPSAHAPAPPEPVAAPALVPPPPPAVQPPPAASPTPGAPSPSTAPNAPPARATRVPAQSSAAAAATASATAQGSASSKPPVAAVPTLDLNALEQRLRDTHAIGVFTKLSLKNQVDDLLAQFKAFHQGHSQLTLAQLRQKYEVLLMKVVSLLQDGDPALASAVSSSREALWDVLTDPKKFANI
jgi:hypothetical protein